MAFCNNQKNVVTNLCTCIPLHQSVFGPVCLEYRLLDQTFRDHRILDSGSGCSPEPVPFPWLVWWSGPLIKLWKHPLKEWCFPWRVFCLVLLPEQTGDPVPKKQYGYSFYCDISFLYIKQYQQYSHHIAILADRCWVEYVITFAEVDKLLNL